MLDITLLGTGGMLPLKNRWLTSCLVSCEGHSVLIDCGEGTQIAVKCAGKKTKNVDMICITHFHADHISGLPGFLLSLGNEGRTEPVTILGPKGLNHIVKSLCVIAPCLTFDLNIREIPKTTNIKCGNLYINPFHAEHGIDCYGYSIELKRNGKFDPAKAKLNNVPVAVWSALQKNDSIEYQGNLYTSDMVLGESRKGIKFTYCTDSRPTKIIAQNAENSDLFICEGLYSQPEKLARAVETNHMIYSEAAQLAKTANVKKLWLTHYSPALTDPEEGIEFARNIFPDAECGFDGKNIDLCYDE